ncbi:MAG: hypothetical protein QOH49_484 [Acidobacteriota bacterium]|jgi:hypothetical protein|nr:hypothetical protein [Acidobacteriota bacterium]
MAGKIKKLAEAKPKTAEESVDATFLQFIEWAKLQPAASESSRMLAEIDDALLEVKNISSEMHRHDEDTARLRQETRRLIDEMMRDLNLKAA